MKPAIWPRDDKHRERLLVVDPVSGEMIHASVRDLPRFLQPGDIVVVNDAATLPARITFEHDGAPAELRIATLETATTARVILFGAGSPRIATEAYGPAPSVSVGDELVLGASLRARVTEVDREHPRLVRVAFEGVAADVQRALFRLGAPIQYAYVAGPLALYHVQTLFASRAWASEMPSAGRPMTFALVSALRAKGIDVVGLTHGAGLSSTGDAALDARLPLRERYEIPASTVAKVAATRARGGRVVAIGTSVARALEASDRAGNPRGPAWTELVLGSSERPRVVSAILTGMHQPGTSHYALLEGFVPAGAPDVLGDAWRAANERGYVEHEFGDSMLVVPSARARARAAA